MFGISHIFGKNWDVVPLKAYQLCLFCITSTVAKASDLGQIYVLFNFWKWWWNPISPPFLENRDFLPIGPRNTCICGKNTPNTAKTKFSIRKHIICEICKKKLTKIAHSWPREWQIQLTPPHRRLPPPTRQSLEYGGPWCRASWTMVDRLGPCWTIV